jgi:2-oxoglutarate dehydrogenase E1 component
MVQAPIFHVNGDDPEACVRVARLAYEYRQAFHKDVVIDMICYRRRGHNEGDEPSFTQPLMYKLIDAKRTTRTLYIEALVGRGDITMEEADEVTRDFQTQLEAIFAAVHNKEASAPTLDSKSVLAPEEANTAISAETARKIAATQVAIPEGFTVHTKLLPQLSRRVEMLNEGTIDWAMGEVLAFGSLLLEGKHIRLAGQDVGRGTFSQRHAVIVDGNNGSEWIPLRGYFQSMQPLVLNTDIQSSAMMHSYSGRLSLVILPTALRRLSMSSSPLHCKSGVNDPLLSCSCLMVMKDKALTTLLRESSGSCNYALKII